MADKNLEILTGYVSTMRKKAKIAGSPGYLHYRVLCDYIREAVASNKVQFNQLGLTDELHLCMLELECAEYAITSGIIIPNEVDSWVKNALQAKISKLHGAKLSQVQEDNVFELFPDVKPIAA